MIRRSRRSKRHDEDKESSDASPFAATAPYYDTFRAAYAQATIDFIIERYNLGERVRAIDLDAVQAPSQSPFLSVAAEIVAIDVRVRAEAALVTLPKRVSSRHLRSSYGDAANECYCGSCLFSTGI